MKLLELKKDAIFPKGTFYAGYKKTLQQWQEVFGEMDKAMIKEWFVIEDKKRFIDTISTAVEDVFNRHGLTSTSYKEAAKEAALICIKQYAARQYNERLSKIVPMSKIEPEKFIEIVADVTGIDVDDMRSKSRQRELVDARMAFCYLCSKYTRLSLKSIGSMLNGRDHTTVIHNVAGAKNLIDTNPEYRAMIETLEAMVA